MQKLRTSQKLKKYVRIWSRRRAFSELLKMLVEGIQKDWHKIAIYFPDILHRPVMKRNLPENFSEEREA